MAPAPAIGSLYLALVLSGLIELLMAESDQPPSLPSSAGAVGSLEGLPAPLRRTFEHSAQFDPMPEPEPGDWLARHPEPGQTFAQFASSPHHRPDGHRNRLYLLPLGDFPREHDPDLHLLRQFTTAFFAMEVELLPALDLEGTFVTRRSNPHTGQEQFHARDILRLLRRRLPRDAFALLGVTLADLYPEPSWNFVFGLASPADRVGVFSLVRYDPRFYGEAITQRSGELRLRRSFKVLAHEMGHMFGIGHCVFFHCLMNGSNHLEEADSRPLSLCPVDLRKLQHSIGFDPIARYGRLLQFTRQVGLEEDARWLTERLDHLREAIE